MEVMHVFGTEVLQTPLESAGPHLSELRERILAERETHPGIGVSAVGGWHSVPDLSRRREPAYRVLIQAIVDATRQMVHMRAASRRLPIPPVRWSVQAWSVVLDSGGYHRVHHHSQSHWSAAFHVDAGDGPSPESGALTLIDPRRGAPSIPGLDLFASSIDIRPVTGSVVLFPSYLQHMVQPYKGDRPRICVSANLTLEVWNE